MRPITSLIVVLVVAPFPRVIAQEHPPAVEPGQRVRVTAPNLGINKHTGVLAAVDSDTLLVDTLRVALASVTWLEVSRGQKSAIGKGAGIGFLVGAGLGAGVGFAFGKALEDIDACDCHPAMMVVGGLGVGALGALIGAGVGAATKSERWEEVPLDQLRVSFAPQRNGRFGLSMSLAF